MYAISLLVVFLCLAALYESWSIPFAVMLSVPVGVVGALGAAMLFGQSNDAYFKVGLLTTVGLTAKNAIMIVEFARALEQRSVFLWCRVCMCWSAGPSGVSAPSRLPCLT